MAKKQDSCPMCAWKGNAGGNQFPPHLDNDGAPCVMSTRPVPAREDEGPVTDGSGPSGSTGLTPAPPATP